MQQNKQNRLIALLCFVLLPFGGLFLILNYLLHAHIACVVLAEIGLIFPMIMISNTIALKKLYKEAVIIGAEVISSKKIKSSDEEFNTYGSCYKTIVVFSHNGNDIEKSLYSEGKIKKQFVNIYYNPKSEEVNLESDIKECENTRKSKSLWIIGFVFFITAAIVEIWHKISINVTAEQFSYGFGLLISIALMGMGVAMLITSEQQKMHYNCREVPGTLVEYRLVDDIKAEPGEKNCFPVYQYYQNGEEKIYVANNYHKKQQMIGTKTSLYIHKNGDVFEAEEIKGGRWIDLAFIIIGLIGIVVCFMNLFVGPLFIL